MTDYRDVNLAHWNGRAAAHAASPDYPVARLVSDPSALSEVVEFDRELLGPLDGQRGIHLQCHIGTDTVSLSRLGATMTGLDFSDKSLEEARTIAARANADVRYVQADVYDALAVAGDGYDFVFTGVGALLWLPDIARWARVVASLLRPGGRLFLREGHPMLWALDDERTDALVVKYPYFEVKEPMVYTGDGSYVRTDVELKGSTSYEWNHGLGEVITALLDAGMTLTGLIEHRSVPWDALPGQMYKTPDGEYHLNENPDRLPLTYTLQAIRTA
ncbi:class I SAM-dependent methyltransferase [Paractinoplanes globisporus]|uniref:Class I SAM-dependent methyltransferase n=1 Tax=Paractinoplanes globisporus TaxID=113565 RepID=A0ABW6WNB0_9ACTN|nr:class I SAM-dependent methyltransferase [Actinoplanes globisporus]